MRVDEPADLCGSGLPGKKRKTRRELILERTDGLFPWQRLEERIRPFTSSQKGIADPTRCR